MSFGRLERREPPKPMGEINMTPLIDVMLVLLVIFIIAAPLMSSSLKLDLPKAEATAPQQGPAAIQVAIDPEGRYYLDEQPQDAAALKRRLSELGRERPDPELQLRADRHVPYGQVAELIGWAQAAGIQRIAFSAESTDAVGPSDRAAR